MEDKVTQLEDLIIRRIFEDNKCTAHFDYKSDVRWKGDSSSEYQILTITTFNPLHGQKFLLDVFTGKTKESCLEKALSSLEKKYPSSYTVTWSAYPEAEGSKTQTSYFVADNMIEALKKFYHDKDIDHKVIVVFNCKLNPIS